jgi:hypothetical protein
MSTTITPTEARRAIVIDFEGTMKDPASLLGVHIDGHHHVVVVEEQLADAATHRVLGIDISYGTLVETLDDIRRRAQHEGRRVFAWSEREIDEILVTVDGDDADWWQANLENARPIAKRWRNRHGFVLPTIPTADPYRSTANPLAAYLALIGYQVPKVHGPGHTGQRIKDVRIQLARRGRFSALTAVAKGKWTKLLQHNRHDCAGLHALLVEIADTTPSAHAA